MKPLRLPRSWQQVLRRLKARAYFTADVRHGNLADLVKLIEEFNQCDAKHLGH